MAEQQTHYEFAAVDSKDILADHQRGWDGFVRASIWCIVATVAVLVLLAIFVV